MSEAHFNAVNNLKDFKFVAIKIHCNAMEKAYKSSGEAIIETMLQEIARENF